MGTRKEADMAAGGEFESLLKGQLERVQGRIVAEHNLMVGRLEAKVAALEEEKQRLLQTCGAPREEFGGAACSPAKGSSCPGGVSAASANGRSSTGAVGMGRCAASACAPHEGAAAAVAVAPRSQLVPERRSPGEHRQSWASPPVDGEEPSLADDPPTPRDSKGGRSPSVNDAGGIHSFRVLELWERTLMRTKSRRISHVSAQTLLTFDDRCSSTSASIAQVQKSSLADPDAGEEQAQQKWLEKKMQRFMLSPSSLRYLCWELLGLALTAHDIVTIPLQTLQPPGGTFATVMSWLIRFFWTFDMLVSFLTGYVSPQGLVELRPHKVARRYMRSRLLFDLALVAVDWVEAFVEAFREGPEDSNVLRLVGMLRAIRLVRLVRLIKSQEIFEFIFEHIRSEGVKLVAYIISIMVVLLCLIHVIACVWHGIHGSGGPTVEEDVAGDRRLVEQYFEAFHYVLSLFAGEQLLAPRNLLERIFTILVLIFAFVVSAAFVGSLTTAMTQLQIIASKRSTQFAALNRYLSDHGISRQLSGRVQRNARHALKERKRHTPESSVELMALISDPLRSEIHYEVYSPLLTAHPFFFLYNTVNSVGVRHICHTAVQAVSLSRGDVLFSEFEVPVSPRMFFVMSGNLTYVRSIDGAQHVRARDWVAEAVLWTHWAHRGTLRCLTESRLLSLDACRLANIMSTFPTLHGVNYAWKFVYDLNQASAERELSDMSGGEEQARLRAASVFQDLDRNMELPPEWGKGRSSTFSVGSLVSTKRLSLRSSKRSSVTTLGPSSAAAVVPAEAG